MRKALCSSKYFDYNAFEFYSSASSSKWRFPTFSHRFKIIKRETREKASYLLRIAVRNYSFFLAIIIIGEAWKFFNFFSQVSNTSSNLNKKRARQIKLAFLTRNDFLHCYSISGIPLWIWISSLFGQSKLYTRALDIFSWNLRPCHSIIILTLWISLECLRASKDNEDKKFSPKCAIFDFYSSHI